MVSAQCHSANPSKLCPLADKESFLLSVGTETGRTGGFEIWTLPNTRTRPCPTRLRDFLQALPRSCPAESTEMGAMWDPDKSPQPFRYYYVLRGNWRSGRRASRNLTRCHGARIWTGTLPSAVGHSSSSRDRMYLGESSITVRWILHIVDHASATFHGYLRCGNSARVTSCLPLAQESERPPHQNWSTFTAPMQWSLPATEALAKLHPQNTVFFPA